MGQARVRRAIFFAAHPKCCFCGGEADATTEDHIPARSVFADRQWPEGHVFPACLACNGASRFDEELLAWVARIHTPQKMSDTDVAEFQALTRNITRHRPELAEKLRLFSRTETRQYLRDRGIPRDSPVLPKELYLVGLPPEVTKAIERYGVKMAKALHYMYSKVIVPPESRIDVRAYTNAELASGEQQWLSTLSILNFRPELVRGGKKLDNRFNYRYVVTPGGDASAFVISFGDACLIVTRVLIDQPEQRSSRPISLD